MVDEERCDAGFVGLLVREEVWDAGSGLRELGSRRGVGEEMAPRRLKGGLVVGVS